MPTDMQLRRVSEPDRGSVMYDSRYGQLEVMVRRHPGENPRLFAAASCLDINNVAYKLSWTGPDVAQFDANHPAGVTLSRVHRSSSRESTAAADAVAGDLVRAAVAETINTFDPRQLADAWLMSHADDLATMRVNSVWTVEAAALKALRDWAETIARADTYRRAATGDFTDRPLSEVRDELASRLRTLLDVAILPDDKRAEVCFSDGNTVWVVASSPDEAVTAAQKVRPDTEVIWVSHNGETTDVRSA